MPADLLESNLFGHVKGAFTGAIASKKGLFELADGGSIFFDEIGNIPLDTQAKLLRVIQEKEFMRLGGVETLKVDVRIIAATNADLEALVEHGHVPRGPLLPAERDHHQPAAAAQAHARTSRSSPSTSSRIYARENEKAIREIAPQAMELLLDYHWPGNVRELENAIERAVVLSTGDELDVDLLPRVGAPAASSELRRRRLPPNGICASRTRCSATSASSSSRRCRPRAACRSGPPSCSRSSPRRSTR